MHIQVANKSESYSLPDSAGRTGTMYRSTNSSWNGHLDEKCNFWNLTHVQGKCGQIGGTHWDHFSVMIKLHTAKSDNPNYHKICCHVVPQTSLNHLFAWIGIVDRVGFFCSGNPGTFHSSPLALSKKWKTLFQDPWPEYILIFLNAAHLNVANGKNGRSKFLVFFCENMFQTVLAMRSTMCAQM